MLRIEKTVLPSPEQWEIIIEGMRNPLNSWDRMDSFECPVDCCDCGRYYDCTNKGKFGYNIEKNDLDLMQRLAKGGAVHAKYRRMIPVWVTLTAPLYWFKEFDTYKVGTVCNSCSTMHKIHEREFTMEDFSIDKTFETDIGWIRDEDETLYLAPKTFFETIVFQLNVYRRKYLATKEKVWWWQMIQLLPSSYNQKRTVMLNYEVLANIYHSRKNHKLDEWRSFCEWIEKLPYAELITGRAENA